MTGRRLSAAAFIALGLLTAVAGPSSADTGPAHTTQPCDTGWGIVAPGPADTGWGILAPGPDDTGWGAQAQG